MAKEKDDITTASSIVGDYKYVLVYETNFSGNKDIDDAAYTIAYTFEWK